MRTQDGLMAAYNIQTVVDAENKMIANADVITENVDFEQLKPALEALKQNIDLVPEEIIADTGYYVPAEIRAIEQGEETKCYVNVPKESKTKKEERENGITFEYDAQKDEYICSQGKRLVLKARGVMKRNVLYDRYDGIECDGCPVRDMCTKAKAGRIIYRRHDHEWKSQYDQRMNQKQGREKLKKRRAVVEHPFGTMKIWMGKLQLLLRGKRKVQIEVDLITTTYNLRRLLNIESNQNLVQMIKNYHWKAA